VELKLLQTNIGDKKLRRYRYPNNMGHTLDTETILKISHSFTW